MEAEKSKIIETLTGIRSSKKNYYVELQQKIEEVTLRNKQLEIINQVAKSFNLNLPIERIVNCLVEKLNTVIPIDQFNLSILVDGECKSVMGYPGSGCNHTNSCSPNGICRYIIKHKQSLILPDDAEALNLTAHDNIGVGTSVFVPLIVKNRVIGILNIKTVQKGAYSPQGVNFLIQLAEHLAVGLNNTKLFSEVLHREREWEDTFRAITDAIVIINSDYTIIRSNETAKKIFPLETDGMENKKCFEIIHHRTEPCDTCPMLAGTAEQKRSYQFIEANENEVYDVYAYPMYGRNGRLRGVYESFKDVSQQMAVESQLIQSEKLAAIGKLAAGVAHELNSPLTAILGNAQLLLREFSPADDNHVLMEDIKQCGVRCKNIILNLLSFARQQHVEDEIIYIDEVINRVVRLVSHQIRQEQIDLVCCRETDLPETTGSSQQLEQVLINLLVNAKDALANREEDKRIVITTGCTTRETGEFLYVSVVDNGCGMNPEQLTEIFTPFYTTKEVGKGTGLGLAVSLGIVQNYGGNIECTSIPGTGSNFTIYLPI